MAGKAVKAVKQRSIFFEFESPFQVLYRAFILAAQLFLIFVLTSEWIALPVRALSLVFVDSPTYSFEFAEFYCSLYHDSHLATIRSASDNAEAQSLCLQGNCWIGLSDSVTEGVFQWRDGSNTSAYSNWLAPNPNDQGGQDCVVMLAGGMWDDVSCTSSKPFLCGPSALPTSAPTRSPSFPTYKPSSAPSLTPSIAPTRSPVVPTPPTKAPSQSPSRTPSRNPSRSPSVKTRSPSRSPSRAPSLAPSRTPSRDTLSRNYIGVPVPKTWLDADQYCQQTYGTTLATITSALENQRASDACLNAGGSSAPECWTGLNDRVTENTFYWSDGTPLGSGYKAWAPSQPDSLGNEDCGTIIWTQNGAWNDNLCLSTLNFVCNAPLTWAPTTPAPTRSRYLPMPSNAKETWSNADAACFNSYGTRLARISSASEAVQAKQTCQISAGGSVSDPECWMGLNDRAVEGAYAWPAGQPLGSGYRNWNTNEPNNANGDEDCVTLYWGNGLWNDQSCSRILPYICDGDFTPSPTSSKAPTTGATAISSLRPTQAPIIFTDFTTTGPTSASSDGSESLSLPIKAAIGIISCGAALAVLAKFWARKQGRSPVSSTTGPPPIPVALSINVSSGVLVPNAVPVFGRQDSFIPDAEEVIAPSRADETSHAIASITDAPTSSLPEYPRIGSQ